MRTLLSTRLFACQPFDASQLRLAREHGFPLLELFASPRHFDLFQLGEVRRVAGLLAAAGMQAPVLHLGPQVLNQLTDDRRLIALGEAIRELRLQAVTADTHSWGVREDGTFLALDDLKMTAQTNGARLVLDLGRIDERILRRLPSDLGVCWDVAGVGQDEEAIREVDEMLEGIGRGRLLGVRVAHRGEAGREVPGEWEAKLLDEVWRLQAPGTIIYDVEDPSGWGSEVELDRALDTLRDFHSGAMRRRPEVGGGIGWASLAPG